MIVVMFVLGFPLAVPIETLAETTSRITLAIFALVNAALFALKRREPKSPAGFRVPIAVPAISAVLCLGLPIASFAT